MATVTGGRSDAAAVSVERASVMVTNEPKEARMSRWLLALLAFATLAVGTIATSGAAGTSDDSGNELAGTWVAVVNRPAPLPPIRSLRVFTDTGSFVESGSDGFSRSPQYGVWERIGGRVYAASGTFFRFDPQTGAHIGYLKTVGTIELAQDGQSFSVVSRFTATDLNGNVLFSSPATGSAERMPQERLP